MLLPDDRAIKELLDKQAVRFAVVGGVGFVVNLGSLYLLHGVYKLPLLVGQIISAEIAILVSFVIHHNWTYRGYADVPLLKRLVTFNISSIAGSAATTIGLFVSIQLLHVHYLVGLVLGAVCGLIWNYFSNKRFIWKKGRSETLHED